MLYIGNKEYLILKRMWKCKKTEINHSLAKVNKKISKFNQKQIIFFIISAPRIVIFFLYY